MNNVSRFPFLLHDLYIYALLTLIRQYDLKYRIFFLNVAISYMVIIKCLFLYLDIK